MTEKVLQNGVVFYAVPAAFATKTAGTPNNGTVRTSTALGHAALTVSAAGLATAGLHATVEVLVGSQDSGIWIQVASHTADFHEVYYAASSLRVVLSSSSGDADASNAAGAIVQIATVRTFTT